MNIGFNFRATSGFVTDPANTTYVLPTDTYPTTRAGVTFGWDTSLSGDDLNAGIDARLAGAHYIGSNQLRDFRVDLDAANTKDIYMAIGYAGFSLTDQQVKIIDGAGGGGVTLFTVTDASIGANHWTDATGTERTSSSDWASNNTSQSAAFSTTVCILRLGDALVSNNHVITHLRISDGGGGSPPSLSTITPSSLPLADQSGAVTVGFHIAGTDLNGSSPSLTPPSGWTVITSPAIAVTSTTIDGYVTIPSSEGVGTKTFTFSTADGSDTVDMTLSAPTGGAGSDCLVRFNGGFN